MTLFEYILKSMPHVNWAVAKNWLGDWAPEEYAKLYDYVEETPWNTNSNFLKEMVNSEEEDGGIVLLNGNIEFSSGDYGFNHYEFTLSNQTYIPSSLVITIDDETSTLPYVYVGGSQYWYGGMNMNSGFPDYSTYPALITITNYNNDCSININIATSGLHAIKLVIPENDEGVSNE